MNTPFSAGPQTLGYLYQAQHALYALLEEDRQEATVVIEGLDDVSLDGAAYVELQQLKHHVKHQATLTNASPELWKTIRVWSTLLKARQWKASEVKLRLITTATASDGTVGALLREKDGRNTDEARRLLLATAANSTNETLGKSFIAFKALTSFEQKLLVEAIIVADASPNIQDLVPKIKKKLFFGPPVDKVDQIYNMLQGWWFDKVADHLLGNSSQPISQIELRLKLEEITSQFQRDSLPIEFADKLPDEAYFTAQKSKNFWRQMEVLNIRTNRMRFAVIDYYRAFEQRTKWAKDTLLVDDELDRYEGKLQEQWERYVEELLDDTEYSGKMDEDSVCVKFGQQVFKWMGSVKMPIRERMPAYHEYVTQGSFHMLADKPRPPVYWHPNFIEELDKALVVAAQ